MIFKVALNNKMRLINFKGKESFEELRVAISQSFSLPRNGFEMSYIDEDGDEITLSDEQDFAILTSSDLKTMKIKVKVFNQENQNQSHNLSSSALANDIEPVEVIKEETKKEGSEVKSLSFEDIESHFEPVRKSLEDLSLDKMKPEPIHEVKREVKKPMEVEIREEMIEEKFKKLLPEIISKVRTEVQQEILEKSKLSSNNQPLIIQEEPEIVEEKPTEQKQPPSKNVVVHINVTCDACGRTNIEGARFKCAICSDFDFCEDCEKTIEHPHPMLKIKKPNQDPIKMFTILKGEDNNLEVNGHRIPSQVDIQNLIQRGLGFVSNFMGGNQRGPQCPYFMNNFTCQREAEKKEEKPVPEEKPKKEENTEMKEERPAAEPKREEKMSQELSEDEIIDKTTYLSECGLDFNKCYQLTRTYPKFSKEELLNICLSNPSILN